MVHHRWIRQININMCVHDRVMAIVFKLCRRVVRIFIICIPNEWNYNLNYFQAIFSDIERLSIEVIDKYIKRGVQG